MINIKLLPFEYFTVNETSCLLSKQPFQTLKYTNSFKPHQSLLREFNERFLISINAIAFRGKMSFTDLASLQRLTLIDQVLTPRDL